MGFMKIMNYLLHFILCIGIRLINETTSSFRSSCEITTLTTAKVVEQL